MCMWRSTNLSQGTWLCLMCSQSNFQREVNELKRIVDALKADLQVIPELRKAEIESMKNKMEEIPILQQKITAMSKELLTLRQNRITAPSNITQSNKRSYAGAVTRNIRPARSYKPENSHAHAAPASVTSGSSVRKLSAPSVSPNTDKSTCAKVKVSGARRIWGTLKSATTSTVSYTLGKLCTLGNQISLKRKYKTNGISARTHWWFIVKGSETDLEELEKQWDHVQLQTGWKLELCYMTSSSNPQHDVPRIDATPCACNPSVCVNSPDPETLSNTSNNSNELTNGDSQTQEHTDGVSQSSFLDNRDLSQII